MRTTASGRPAQQGDHPGPGQGLAITAASLFMLLAYPVIGMFGHHGYPLIAPESAVIFTADSVLAVALAVLLLYTRTAVKNLVFGVVVTIAFMIHFNLLFVGMAAVLAASLVLGILLGDRYTGFVAAVLVALILGSWLDDRLDPATRLSDPQPLPAPAGRGPVVHILMDGFMAPDGLPRDEISGSLRADILAFFVDQGFDLHTRAYSHYNSTLDSMTRAFNFRDDDANLFQRAAVLREPLSFPENAWFDILANAGYGIHIYQSEAVDFCSAAVVSAANCNVFPIPNLKTVNRELSDITLRVEVLLRTLAGQSGVLTTTLRKARVLDTWGVAVHDERLLPKLARDLPVRPGDAYFAHVLIPHSPFVLREDCSIDYTGARGYRWGYLAGSGGSSPEALAKRDGKRAAQTRCALRLLGELFEVLRTDGLFDDATIIVHGDHGSSVHRYRPSVYNAERLTQRDLLEAFSTLFAVKWPGGEGGLRSEVASLDVLLAETARRLVGQDSRASGIAAGPFVYLSDAEPLQRLNVNIFDDPAEVRQHP